MEQASAAGGAGFLSDLGGVVPEHMNTAPTRCLFSFLFSFARLLCPPFCARLSPFPLSVAVCLSLSSFFIAWALALSSALPPSVLLSSGASGASALGSSVVLCALVCYYIYIYYIALLNFSITV